MKAAIIGFGLMAAALYPENLDKEIVSNLYAIVVQAPKSDFDYDSTFNGDEHQEHPHEEEPEPVPTPTQPDVSDDSETLGPSDMTPQEWEPEPEIENEEYVPIVEQPQEDLRWMDRQSRHWMDSESTFSTYLAHDQAPQLIALTGCGWNQRNRKGEFNSYCTYCNYANTAIEGCIKNAGGAWSVGEDPNNDIWIVNVESDWGHAVNLKMGENGRTFTEIVNKQKTGQYADATPVFVVRYPDKDPLVIQGWPPKLNPRSSEALWYISGLLGHRKDTPETWSTSQEYGPLAAAMSAWAVSENKGYGGWGATVPIRDVIEFFAPGGMRQLSKNTKLVVPNSFRPQLVGNNVQFRNPPRIEYVMAGFIPRKMEITHARIEPDFSKITFYAKGYLVGFPINLELDWGDQGYFNNSN